MIQSKYARYINVDDFSLVPKYLQISNAIMSAVDSGVIAKGETLPSINDLSNELCVSRGTIEKGYRNLVQMKALLSSPGKGYYVTGPTHRKPRKVCLLFNKLSEHKKIIYDSFISKLGEIASVEFLIYNSDSFLFRSLLEDHQARYTHYVIIPHFLNNEELALSAINNIPKDKLIMVDKKINGITGEYGMVYENFEWDIYSVFCKARQSLRKYHTIKILFPENSYYPKEIIKGLVTFCRQYEFKWGIINAIADEELQEGTVYVNLREDDLVQLLQKVIDSGLNLGSEIGVISYNETPVKKLLLNGITTISTDFALLGSQAAQLVLDNSRRQIAVPFDIKIRPSI
jgi:DNA-binding transcriptional regulator YhcF (GntR family)